MDTMAEETKEYIWCTKLDKKETSHQWDGLNDGRLEQLVLKRACLGSGAKAGEKNLVELTSFNYEQDKVKVCICSLKEGLQEDINLGDLTIFPPIIVKLVEGSGPVHLIGNHMLMVDDFDSDGEGSNASSDEEEAMSDHETIPTEKQNGKKKAKQQAKEESVDEEDGDDYTDDDDEGEDIGITKEEPTVRKRKLSEQKLNEEKKSDTDTPRRKKKATEATTPQVTPKQKENKTPLSTKKTPAKSPPASLEAAKDAIKKYSGGKPKKEDKFKNWVKSAFKIQDEGWVKELWQSHKKELGL